LDQALAAVSYEYPWSGVVVDFKFHQRTGWARSLAALMRSVPWVEPALDAADWLIPLPLARERLQERGFNQTLLMARALEPRKVRADVLLRIHNTPAQSSLARKDRLASVTRAFAVEPLVYTDVAHKRIVLVDDVMTSGASLSSAASALRSAGAAHITGLVFARTESQWQSA
jgi:ComF family protein